MGMAASQARLLSITARVHDVELEAQYIMSQKIALATQKDELYNEYMNALDAKKIQVAFYGSSGSKSTHFVDATYASVCGYNPDRKGTYALIDANSGKMIVEPEIYEAYKAFQGKDKYAFALQMLGFSEEELNSDNLNFANMGLAEGYVNNIDSSIDPDALNNNEYSGSFVNSKTGKYDGYMLMNNTEAKIYESHKEESSANNLAALMTKVTTALEKGDRKEIDSAIEAFRKELYSKYAGEIYDGICEEIGADNMSEFDSDLGAEFNYYIQIFEGIEAAGGCITLNDFAKNGDTGNDWFNNIIKSGRAQLMEYNSTGTKKGTWSETSVATSTNLSEVEDDTNVKKAEAKYNYELDKINKKDTKFDEDLNKLETERTALEKERDSVKQVKDDNIDRTFKIFS